MRSSASRPSSPSPPACGSLTEACSAELLNRPDFLENASEVAAENGLDIGVAVLPPDQRCGKIERPLGKLVAVDVDLVTEAVAAFITGLELLVFVWRHGVIAKQVDVAAHSQVFDA